MSKTEIGKPETTVENNVDCWLTINEAAKIAAMKVNTMYTCCLRRCLPSYKVGTMRRVKKSDLLAWLESGRVEAARS